MQHHAATSTQAAQPHYSSSAPRNQHQHSHSHHHQPHHPHSTAHPSSHAHQSAHASTSHLPSASSHAYTHQPDMNGDHMVVVGGRQSPAPNGPAGSAVFDRVGGSDTLSQDTILQAIDRLGLRMDTQLSRLAYQVTSMQVVVDQLVDQQRKAGRFVHQPDESHQASSTSSWQQQQQQQQPLQQHQSDRSGPTITSPRSSTTNIRRDSEHPFAFDPAADTTQVFQSTGASVPASTQSHLHRHSYQNDYPHHHQSSVRALPAGPEASVAGSSDVPMGYVSSHHQATASTSSNADMSGSRQHLALEENPSLGGTLSFSAGGSGQPDLGDRYPSPEEQRPETSYAVTTSVRPFTAVDHSHRPQAAAKHNHNGQAGGNSESAIGHAQSSNDSMDQNGGVNSVEFELQNSAVVPGASTYSAPISSHARGIVPSPRHGMAFSRVSPRQLAVGNGRLPGYSTEEPSGSGGLEGASSTPSSLAGHVHSRSLYTDSVTPSDQPFHPFPSHSHGYSSSSHQHHHQAPSIPQAQSFSTSSSALPRGYVPSANGNGGAVPSSHLSESPSSLSRKRQARLSPPQRSSGAAPSPSAASTSDMVAPLRRLKREPTVVSAHHADFQTSHSPEGAYSGTEGAPVGPMGSYQFWAFTPPQPSENKLRLLPEPQFRTLQAARLDLQRKTGRTMAKLGRLPLKDYLEVSSQEYLHARKTGRAVYNEWLEPLVRMAKQPKDRVKACTNFIEYTHPMLAQCEGSFKARQLLQQIVDNAIDEATNARKKDVAGPGSGHVSSPSASGSWGGHPRGLAAGGGPRQHEHSGGTGWSVASGESDPGGGRSDAGPRGPRLVHDHGRDHEGDERHDEGEDEDNEDEEDGGEDDGDEGEDGPDRKRRRGEREDDEERDELE